MMESYNSSILNIKIETQVEDVRVPDLHSFNMHGNMMATDVPPGVIHITPEVDEPMDLSKTSNQYKYKTCEKENRQNMDTVATEKGQFQCQICDKTFMVVGDLEVHVKQIHNIEEDVALDKQIKVFKCVSCEAAFPWSKDLTVHVKLYHNTEKPKRSHYFTCHICGDKFSANRTLLKHMSTHVQDTSGFIGNDFMYTNIFYPTLTQYNGMLDTQNLLLDQASLPRVPRPLQENSKLNHTSDKEKPSKEVKEYKCKECSEIFATRSGLTRHTKTHKITKKTHECDICQKVFSTNRSMSVHRKNHTGEGLPYECDICQRRFTWKSHMEIHKRTHSNVKPYKCDYCDRSFTQVGNLNSHKRTHSGLRPYMCRVCGKTFGNSSNLVKHESQHPGLRPSKQQSVMAEVC